VSAEAAGLQRLVPDLIDIAHRAGDAIMAVYASADAKATTKGDGSPLTAADLAAQAVIAPALTRLTPDITVLSEESAQAPYETRRSWRRSWVVDPLDGTKEFLGRSGEFTVNIALVEDGRPVLGVVHAPAISRSYWGAVGSGAFRTDAVGTERAVRVSRREGDRPWRVVASKSHNTPETDAFLARLGPHERVAMGSSLKLCLVADGSADLYPRFGPTSEWDTAAAHAVVTAAGGRVVTIDGDELRYNKADILNPHFIACGAALPPPVQSPLNTSARREA
jgi:3'(2'), 5'-bisphosphate nucleotidase